MRTVASTDVPVPPRPFRRPALARGLHALGVLTAGLRMLPSFLIIGAQRCGTSSLYDLLRRHPQVLPALRKEVHFFDLNFHRGITWYRAHFPTPLGAYAPRRLRKRPVLTGEASPYYLFHPRAPRRARQVIPGARLLVLIRNPVDRAYSNYHFEVRLGNETLPFAEAVRLEARRLRGEEDRLLSDEGYVSFNHRHFAYLARGVYADQIARWLDAFGRDQMLVVRSEDLFAAPARVLGQVEAFLGLAPGSRPRRSPPAGGGYPPMDPGLRRELAAYFAPHNRRLAALLGRELGWDA